MLKNVTILSLTQCVANKASLIKNLSMKTFNPCSASAALSTGFSPVMDGGELAHATKGGEMLINFTIEKKKLPGSVVKELVKERVQAEEKRTGAKCGRREIKSIKEAVIDELMPRVLPVKSSTLAWISPNNRLLVINSTSKSVVESLLTSLLKCESHEIVATPLETAVSPSAAMKEWMLGDGPDGFVFDRDCVLKHPATGATLRFTKHTLDGVAEQLNDGKLPSELSMTWNDRLSFTLGGDLSIKKIHVLDVVLDGVEPADDPVAAFEMDFLIVSNELTGMLKPLFEALGCVKQA